MNTPIDTTSRLAWKEQQRARTIEEIKRIARDQLAEGGTTSLSLGGIAREMGLTTPALYRYFSSRDALVTALIIDAYRDLNEETRLAGLGVDEDAIVERFDRMVTAYRYWALARPQEYILIHGAVAASYHAPVVGIIQAAFGCLKRFVDILLRAERTHTLQVPDAYRNVSQGLGAALSMHPDAADLPPHLVTLAYMIWLQVHGLVWQELAGHLPSILFQDGRLFRAHMQSLRHSLGLIRDEERTD